MLSLRAVMTSVSRYPLQQGKCCAQAVIREHFSTDKKVLDLKLKAPFRTSEATTLKETHQTLVTTLRQGGNIDSLMNIKYLSLSSSTLQEVLVDAKQSLTPIEKQNAAWALYNLTKYSDHAFLMTPEARDTLISLYKSLGSDTDTDSESAKVQIAKAIVNCASKSKDASVFCTPEIRDILLNLCNQPTLSYPEIEKMTKALVNISASHPEKTLFCTREIIDRELAFISVLQARLEFIGSTSDVKGMGIKELDRVWHLRTQVTGSIQNIIDFIRHHANLNLDSQTLVSTPEVRDMLVSSFDQQNILATIQAIVCGNLAGKEVFSTPEVRDILIKLGNAALGGPLSGVHVNQYAIEIEETINGILADNPRGKAVFDTPEIKSMLDSIRSERRSARDHPGF